MTKQHRATNLQWACIKARTCDESDVVAYSTIHELLCRIEALEARNEDDKEAWAAMRRAGSSHGERIGALMERIEDLENDRRAILNSRSRPRTGLHGSPAKSNHPAKPDSSLVERVAAAITGEVDDPIKWKPEARAAMREVAAWLREQNPCGVGVVHARRLLEQEAER